MTATELEGLIGLLTSREQLENPTPDEMRDRFNDLIKYLPVPDDAERTEVDAGGVPAEFISAPGANPDRSILYLHGGGYVIGSIATHRRLAYDVSEAAGARVLLIDYRLAPEHPFPAAVDDAVAAYKWLMANGATPEKTAIAGDSAGGGLTVAALVALRDAGEPLPAMGYCISPWTDMEGSGESMRTKADVDPLIQPEALTWFANHYLNGADPTSPLATQLNADLAGLPPLLIQVGTAEVLLDDSTRLEARAKAAGVDVTLEAWDDMIHVWHLFAPMLSEGRDATARAGAFIREKIA
ncbi:MAG: alpha/beta hydrolase [Minwuiales bacterium]|nr:alpha/beta hydrolase [Minwuiales bacterium]